MRTYTLFCLSLGMTILLCGCEAMQLPGWQYDGYYSGTMLMIERLHICDHPDPAYFVDDSTWTEYSFTLVGKPWSNEYEYYYGKERPRLSREIFTCAFSESGHCWVYGDKYGSFGLSAGDAPGQINVNWEGGTPSYYEYVYDSVKMEWRDGRQLRESFHHSMIAYRQW